MTAANFAPWPSVAGASPQTPKTVPSTLRVSGYASVLVSYFAQFQRSSVRLARPK